jgi:hypothetical protein
MTLASASSAASTTRCQTRSPRAATHSPPRGLRERQAGDAQLVGVDGEQAEAEVVEAGGDGVGDTAGEPHAKRALISRS